VSNLQLARKTHHLLCIFENPRIYDNGKESRLLAPALATQLIAPLQNSLFFSHQNWQFAQLKFDFGVVRVHMDESIQNGLLEDEQYISPTSILKLKGGRI
jgi:hypothetical protein